MSRLEKELGRLLCFLYAEIRGDIAYAFEGRMLEMVIGNEALIEIYNLFEEGIFTEREVKDVLYWCVSDYCDVTLTYRIRECLDPSLDFAKKIIMESDLSDLSYAVLVRRVYFRAGAPDSRFPEPSSGGNHPLHGEYVYRRVYPGICRHGP